MGKYATHQVEVDFACEASELRASKVPDEWHVCGNLRKELTKAGLFARVLDAEGPGVYLRLFGGKKKLQAYLEKSGCDLSEHKIIKRPKVN